MLFKIIHKSTYHYDKPVFSEPHHLYFYPLHRNYIKEVSMDIKVSPNPAGSSVRMDIENNRYLQCWFNSVTDKLVVDLEMILETTPFNLFEYLLEERPKTPHSDAIDLYKAGQVPLTKEITDWLHTFDQSDATTFIGKLCNDVHERWQHTTSHDSELLDPNICFSENRASCRDLAWMMIQMFRHLRYPARFVSGYSYNPEITGHELHAWVEVWLAGAGWIGLDPSSGLFITETYFPIAASYHPVNTLPIQGTYRGEANSELETKVEILVL